MKITIISIILAVLLIIGAVWMTSGSSASGDNVTIENGTQIVSITAKGGYYPKKSIAKANTETILRVATTGTFDCSTALVIPQLNFREYLPTTGTTDIKIPSQEPNTTLTGLCSMGMYSFQIKFE